MLLEVQERLVPADGFLLDGTNSTIHGDDLIVLRIHVLVLQLVPHPDMFFVRTFDQAVHFFTASFYFFRDHTIRMNVLNALKYRIHEAVQSLLDF